VTDWIHLASRNSKDFAKLTQMSMMNPELLKDFFLVLFLTFSFSD
jgi:hypothetical protein